MKKECAVVQDLLVLYEDEVLHEESMQMVEEHIRSCEECMKIYENLGKELRVSSGEPETPKEKQEEDAARILKKESRRISVRMMVIFATVIAFLIIAVIIADELCNQYTNREDGIAGLIYAIPSEEIEVTELYQLKNGDIYCTLKSGKPLGIQSYEWVVPDGHNEESTDEAVQEIRFRERTPWEWDGIEYDQISLLFAAKRKGVLLADGEEITQNCGEISFRGRAPSDRLVIWEKGQQVEEAPESIEKKAIRGYIQQGQIEKALEECENFGWDSDTFIREEITPYSEGRYIYYDSDGNAVDIENLDPISFLR